MNKKILFSYVLFFCTCLVPKIQCSSPSQSSGIVVWNVLPSEATTSLAMSGMSTKVLEDHLSADSGSVFSSETTHALEQTKSSRSLTQSPHLETEAYQPLQDLEQAIRPNSIPTTDQQSLVSPVAGKSKCKNYCAVIKDNPRITCCGVTTAALLATCIYFGVRPSNFPFDACLTQTDYMPKHRNYVVGLKRCGSCTTAQVSEELDPEPFTQTISSYTEHLYATFNPICGIQKSDICITQLAEDRKADPDYSHFYNFKTRLQKECVPKPPKPQMHRLLRPSVAKNKNNQKAHRQFQPRPRGKH